MMAVNEVPFILSHMLHNHLTEVLRCFVFHGIINHAFTDMLSGAGMLSDKTSSAAASSWRGTLAGAGLLLPAVLTVGSSLRVGFKCV